MWQSKSRNRTANYLSSRGNMTQVSSADGRLILTCDAFNVGGYNSGHRVNTYRTPLPNAGDILTYIGGGDAYFVPATSVAGAVNDLRIEGNTVNTVTLAVGSRSIGIGQNTTEVEAGVGAASRNFIAHGAVQTSAVAEDNFLFRSQLQVAAGGVGRSIFMMSNGSIAVIGAGCFASADFIYGRTLTVNTTGAAFFDNNILMGTSNVYTISAGSCRNNTLLGNSAQIQSNGSVVNNAIIGEGVFVILTDAAAQVRGNTILGYLCGVSAAGAADMANSLLYSHANNALGAGQINHCLLLLNNGAVDLTAGATLQDCIGIGGGAVYTAGVHDECHWFGDCGVPNELDHSIMFGLEGTSTFQQEVFRICQDGAQISRVEEHNIPVAPAIVTVLQLLRGYITTSVGGAVNLVLPSAADFNAEPQTGYNGYTGMRFSCLFVPKNALDQISFAAGVGTTFYDNVIGTAGKAAMLYFTRVGPAAWEIARVQSA